MYPGLSSLLQQLAADPSDELLASRIVSLLQDIPDGEYKVDQLLAAAQMMLAVSPRLGLICAHAAFRSAPSRLESLAIAEEALAKMGRRAKVQVLRQERKRMEAEVVPNIELTATVSKFLLNEESAPDAPETPQPRLDATVLISSPGATVPLTALDHATNIAKLKGDALFDAVEKISETAGLDLAAARMTAFLVVDAVLARAETTPDPNMENPYEVATGDRKSVV